MHIVEQPCEAEYPHEAHQHRHGKVYDSTQPIFWCGGLAQATPTEHVEEPMGLSLQEVLEFETPVETQLEKSREESPEKSGEKSGETRTDEKYIRLQWDVGDDGNLQFSIELSGKIHEAVSVMRLAELRLIGYLNVTDRKDGS